MTKRRHFQVFSIIFIAGFPVTAMSWEQWKFSELYTNADHSVQFIEMTTVANNQNILSGKRIRSVITGDIFVFPNNLPNVETQDKKILLATPDYASTPGSVTPDFILPNDFIAEGDGLLFENENGINIRDIISFCQPQPAFPGQCLPIDAIHSMDTNLNPQMNSPTNFAGETGFLNPVDLNHVFINFDTVFSGNGSQGAPFSLLSEAVHTANTSALLEVHPGLSAETLIISKSLTILNANPQAGVVRVGSIAFRGIKAYPLPRVGFISRSKYD